MNTIEKSYALARERYATMQVDTDAAMEKLAHIAISIHCWQGDDVNGFENSDVALGGGLQTTGNYLGKAHNADELRLDLEKALSFIPGTHRVNLHAIYAETNSVRVERDQLETKHFQNWIDWAKTNNLGLDFNPTMFSHPKADDGFTLSHADKSIRDYWIAHAIACRKIAHDMGKALGSPAINSIWIPDGSKDTPVDRKNPRLRLQDSLDQIFASANNPEYLLDAVECKLFGIGSESYVVGSHEFYMGYATKNNKLLCLDAGHFHPTEVISDKISAVMTFVDEILLHVSRGVRWDSDHVVTLTDELYAIAQEIVRGNCLSRVHIALDFFDASINRIAAWVIGTRAMQKALLVALLEPIEQLRAFEAEGDNSSRLAMFEELKTMPSGAIWDYFCAKHNVGVGFEWMTGVKQYEKDVLALR